MPIYDSECIKCGKTGIEYVSLADLDQYDANPRACECGGGFKRVLSPTAGRVKLGGEADYHREVAGVRRKCQEHFVKSGEMDQCRHKFGKTFDDALVSAAASRIEEGKDG